LYIVKKFHGALSGPGTFKVKKCGHITGVQKLNRRLHRGSSSLSCHHSNFVSDILSMSWPFWSVIAAEVHAMGVYGCY